MSYDLIVRLRVPNAKKGRDDLELAVFGMQNVPEDAIELKRAEQLGQPLPKKPKPDADVPSVAAATTAAAATDRDTAPVVPGTLSGAPTTYYASGTYPSSSSATGYGNAWGSGAGAPSTADAAEEYMIYTDEAVSVEEKRASLPQYRPANAPASIDVDQLQSSIQVCLHRLQCARLVVSQRALRSRRNDFAAFWRVVHRYDPGARQSRSPRAIQICRRNTHRLIRPGVLLRLTWLLLRLTHALIALHERFANLLGALDAGLGAALHRRLVSSEIATQVRLVRLLGFGGGLAVRCDFVRGGTDSGPDCYVRHGSTTLHRLVLLREKRTDRGRHRGH